jgi:organic radical activating enzyme
MVVFTGINSAFGQQGEVTQPAPKEKSSTVSSEELKTFATIYKKVQKKNKEAQQVMAKTIQDEGITIQRYQTLAKSSKKKDSKVKATETEKKQMKSIDKAFAGIQNSFKSKIRKIIKENGMSTKRYQQVYQMIRKDKELQAELGEIMQG